MQSACTEQGRNQPKIKWGPTFKKIAIQLFLMMVKN